MTYPAASAENWPKRGLRNLHERPYRIAFALQVTALGVAAVLYFAATSVLPTFAPKDPGGSLEVLWQVHGVFVSLAFAGLAILFQLGSESLVTGRSLRTALFRQTLFRFTFAFCVLSLLQLGAVAIWLPDDSTLILEFIVAACALGLVAYAYTEAASVFENPEKGERLGAAQLVEALQRSQRQDWATGHANRLLEMNLPELLSSPPSDASLRRTGMVKSEGVVTDINDVMIKAVLKDLPAMAPLLEAEQQPSQGESLGLGAPASLRLKGRVGARVGPGRPVFELHHGEMDGRRLQEIEARLRTCVELSVEY